jgi:putative restriction endonuclease
VPSLYVAITDRGWYLGLRNVLAIDEVNFWRPGRTPFRALKPGQLFLFKLHYPENAIVGGGVFAHYSLLPVSIAWDAFGEKNGVLPLGHMLDRLMSYQPALRTMDLAARLKYEIGCILLEQPFFFGEKRVDPYAGLAAKHSFRQRVPARNPSRC